MPRNWAWGKKKKSGYRSGLEETVAKTLKEKGVTFQYEPIKLEYHKTVTRGRCGTCGGKAVFKLAYYCPDFVLDNGRIIEVKGRFTASDRSKLLAVRTSNPDKPIHLYFGSDNKLTKASSRRYSDWATDKGFDFSIGVIPRRWLSARRSRSLADGTGVPGRQSEDGIRDEEDPT